MKKTKKVWIVIVIIILLSVIFLFFHGIILNGDLIFEGKLVQNAITIRIFPLDLNGYWDAIVPITTTMKEIGYEIEWEGENIALLRKSDDNEVLMLDLSEMTMKQIYPIAHEDNYLLPAMGGQRCVIRVEGREVYMDSVSFNAMMDRLHGAYRLVHDFTHFPKCHIKIITSKFK